MFTEVFKPCLNYGSLIEYPTNATVGLSKALDQTRHATPTSNLENVGNDLVDTVLRKVRVPLTDERVVYIKIRLFDRVYANLKTQATQWSNNPGQPIDVQMELQDVYLADTTLPSQVGKLVKEDWRKYPSSEQILVLYVKVHIQSIRVVYLLCI